MLSNRFFQGLFFCLTLVLTSCGDGQTSVASLRKVKCERVVVAEESLERVSFPGKVVAATDVNLGFRVAGIVDEICVANGAFVRQGDVVARLDSRDYALQLSATQAEYDAVKAEVDRVVLLFEDKSVSENSYDKAVNGLKAITAKLEAHKNALYDTDLRAPFDGYLQKSNFDRGEAVAAGTPVVSFISASAPEVMINIPAAYYLKQSSFESAVARIDLFGEARFNLVLKSVSPKANLNQLYQMTFVVESVDGVLPAAGMTAMVEMNYRREGGDDLVSIPFKSVVERGGSSFVWVFANGEVRSREVVVDAVKSSGRAVLSRGVEVGEMVVSAGVNSLEEGQKVELLKGASASNVGGIK